MGAPRRFSATTFEQLGHHDRAIMRLLRDLGPCSRTTLAAEMEVSSTTITKTVAPLIARGYIEEQVTAAETRVGRPAIPLAAVPDAATVCGVQLGVGVVNLGLTNARAETLTEDSFAFDPATDPTVVLDKVTTAIEKLLAEAESAPCLAIGVAAPGPVDTKRRTNLMSVHLGWRHVPIADLLEARLNIPVFVDHNVRAMALAETLYGRHDVRDLAYVHIKTGLGLGLVLDRKPFYAGIHGLSELGHVRAVSSGRTCACGARGCLETVVSETSLLDSAIGAGIMPQDGAPPTSPLAVVEALAAAGDDAARRIRAELVQHLAAALANVVNLFNPQLILLGGMFEAASESLMDDVHAATRSAVYPVLRDEFRIRRPSLRTPGVVGGAALALEEVFYGSR
ncbi:ROK family transcriptional regulator [Plantactinospora sp. KBS50]|uniref:ROK family transcriptional regulator n=1 Tax=Plantactinospora sp. KBS50 TaxID=2024580 RepID=UPI000BAAB37C|nr:ROK family transcriptional regulator [Plantactinospora sp. KBS50]ASW55736.1 hypothetical protein CIK06_18420 [Plantactinospora sp. KBS50]